MTPLAPVMLALLTVWVRPDSTTNLIAHVRDAGGPEYVVHVAELVEEAAWRWHVDPDLLAALAMHESGFDHEARTPWACGVMQVNPRHRAVSEIVCCGADTPGCLEWNIDRGAMLLAEALGRCEDEWNAIGGYRVGPCQRRLEDQEILRTRLLFRAARCVLDDAQRQTLRAGCAEREGLMAALEGA